MLLKKLHSQVTAWHSCSLLALCPVGQDMSLAYIFLPFVLTITFCISSTNFIFLHEMQNQLLHFEDSFPPLVERWIHCRSSCKQLQLLLPKFYTGWGDRCCKPTLVDFPISYCKDNLDNFAFQVKKKKKGKKGLVLSPFICMWFVCT